MPVGERPSAAARQGPRQRADLSNEGDPLRVFPELFNARATGRGVATGNVGGAPEFDVAETSEGFLLSAWVPGITAAQLEVRVTFASAARTSWPAVLPSYGHCQYQPIPWYALRLATSIASVAVGLSRPKMTASRHLLTGLGQASAAQA